MQYEIVATLGPHSEDPKLWEFMRAAGVTAFRLNTSHLSLLQLGAWLDKFGPFLATGYPELPLILDLQGSKWRVGEFAPFELPVGASVTLIYGEKAETPGVLPVPHRDFFQAAAVSNGELVLNDARIRLAVESLEADRLQARVRVGGWISPRKGVTFTASDYRQEVLGDKDQQIMAQTSSLSFIRYAVSYVRDAKEMANYRAVFGPAAYLIAKLERRPALVDVQAIAESADALWLCRGDLGAELGIAEMAEAVADFSLRVREYGKPVLMAGQVLEHMVEHLNATRSEVCYLYEALQRGYAGVVLSDETAMGQYPLECCQTAAMFKKK